VDADRESRRPVFSYGIYPAESDTCGISDGVRHTWVGSAGTSRALSPRRISIVLQDIKPALMKQAAERGSSSQKYFAQRHQNSFHRQGFP
jgi:hypothetical protein